MDKKLKKIKILKINDDRLLTTDFQEFIAIMDILENQHKQFPILHKKLHTLKKKYGIVSDNIMTPSNTSMKE